MSNTNIQCDSLHEQQIKSNPEHISTIINSNGTIRQRVEDRHWQLFEARLKKQLPEVNKENYTNTNDYRIIDRLKKIDQPQPPIEPNQRWKIFCNQVTNKSNETNRVMSIFHNVWQQNWNTKQTDEIQKRRMTDPTGNENTFLNRLSTNDNDRKVISSILHRTASSENVSSNKNKKNLS
jgi:hypothetical protein